MGKGGKVREEGREPVGKEVDKDGEVGLGWGRVRGGEEGCDGERMPSMSSDDQLL